MLKSLSKNYVNELLNYFSVEHENSYEFEEGDITDIIFSAPHSVSQTRNGKIKCAEPYTGVIAKILHKNYGYSVLYKTKNCGDDANYDEKSPYKNKLYAICRKYKPILVIDLHGLSKKRDCIINLGTNFGNTLQDDTETLNELIHCLRNAGINKITTDHPFFASENTIASSVSRKLKQKAIQIEINFGYLDKSPEHILNVINALHSFCQKIRKRNVVRSRVIDIARLRDIDEKFYQSQSLNDFEYVSSMPEIVLSAPHAKQSMLYGKVKASESMTGSICKLFYKEFGFSIIYKSRDNEIDYFNTKYNDYKNTLFKNVIKNQTKLFLELHILNKERVQDVTMFLPEDYDKEKFYQIINILNKHGLEYFSINSIFDSYKKSRTINQIRNDCFKLQLCFNQRLIDNDETLLNCVNALKDIISLFLD